MAKNKILKTKSWLCALAVFLLGLGYCYNFQMKWADYGTYTWIVYWSHAQTTLDGDGCFDDEALIKKQASVEFESNNPHDPYNNTHFPSPAYPPVLLWLFIPFAMFGFTTATLLWLAFKFITYIYAALLFNRVLNNNLDENVVLLLALFFPPVFFCFYNGGISGMQSTFIIFAWYAQRQNYQKTAGLCLVPLLLKLNLSFVSLCILFLEAIRRRHFVTLITFFSAVFAMTLATFAIDPNWIVCWWPKRSLALEARTISILQLVCHNYNLPQILPIAMGFGCGALFGVWRYCSYKEITPYLLAECAIISLIFSPYLWPKETDLLLPMGLLTTIILVQQKKLKFALLSYAPILYVTRPEYWLYRLEGSTAPAAQMSISDGFPIYYFYISILVGLWIWALYLEKNKSVQEKTFERSSENLK